ncbi:phosphoribosylamine--glycine ligase [Enteractinococcus coprophilus]|uniref:Phosphoribosylamine--glycine ligase n=1 Tax=Enteractinococcus coprophilus TaxID=1027633 RepID=A0A543AM73_9MICC|nr:phosphoribosylamine--glycine ligase [Enteractinococcus coprophilus]TQL73666.1 phosphoribosylamine--glycine ligase [Enteractinococcus coprophilus]
MKTLVLGPGGREHAIVQALRDDPLVSEVRCAPGNAGIAKEVPVYPIDVSSPQLVVELCQELQPDLVVVGPEALLAAGVTNALQAAGFAVFGPTHQAARLESSKAFAKEIMHAAGVPTGQAHTATNLEQLEAALDDFGAPYVVKDDGLAAGKGVIVTQDRDAAIAHGQAIFAGGDPVLVEEFLDGPEVSVFVIADGKDGVAMSPAQDFKRIYNDDEGPNTGGMGAYTPLEWLPENFTEDVMAQVARPVLAEMAERGTPFTGVLYCGLAVTKKGIQVIEFNARFGDPETQPVLARLKTPLGQLLQAAADGKLATTFPTIQFHDNAAVGVVVASEGYPETPKTGAQITGVADAAQDEDVTVLHAGTTAGKTGEFTASGGRVLTVVATGKDLGAARDKAYAAVEKISIPNGQYRTDIAAKAINGEITISGASDHD